MPQQAGNFALEFDGVDDLVELPSLAIDSNNPFTCEVYITPHSVLKESDPEWRGYVIMGPFSFDVRWIAKVGTSHLYVVRKGYVVGPPIEGHRKVHVAACFDGNSLQLFVDGHSSEVKATPEKLTTTSKGFRLAASLDSKRSNWNFHGLIDELRISSKVRYTADFTPELRFEPDDDTVALYHFDEGTGDILRDSSNNHYDGKIVGAKWVRADGSPINSAPASTSAPPLAKAPFDAAQAKAHQEAWAKHLGTQVETTNSVGMKMVLIPSGEFMMGSTDEQVEAALKVAEEIKAEQHAKDRIQKNERPQHKVVITKPFLMSSREVTVGQFKKFTATGYQTEAEKPKPTFNNVQRQQRISWLRHQRKSRLISISAKPTTGQLL